LNLNGRKQKATIFKCPKNILKLTKEFDRLKITPDPNFDFGDRNVKVRKPEQMQKKKEKKIIKKYYKRIAQKEGCKKNSENERDKLRKKGKVFSLTRKTSTFKTKRER
jgi:hypothetical protein